MQLDWRRITPEALHALELEKLLLHIESRRCFEFSQELANLRNQTDRWSPDEAACLEFAVQVTGMTLRCDQPSEPFGPMFQWGDGRSAIPADFPKETLVAVYPWAVTLQDAELRARFLDTIWVKGKHFMAAKEAVVAYLASAKELLDPEHWTDFAQRLERALRLAASLGKGGSELRDVALAETLRVVRKLDETDPSYLTMRLTHLLLEFRYGDASEFVNYTAKAAQAAEANRDFWRAKDYFNLAANCCREANLSDEEGMYRRAAAESLVKEAEAARGQPGRGAIVTASVLSSAV